MSLIVPGYRPPVKVPPLGAFSFGDKLWIVRGKRWEQLEAQLVTFGPTELVTFGPSIYRDIEYHRLTMWKRINPFHFFFLTDWGQMGVDKHYETFIIRV